MHMHMCIYIYMGGHGSPGQVAPCTVHHAPCTVHHAPCTMPRHVPPRQVDGLVAALPRVFGPVKEKLLEKLLAQERRYLPPTRYDALTTTH